MLGIKVMPLICPTCGREVTSPHCAYCQPPAPPQAEPALQRTPPSARSIIIACVLGALLLFSVAAALIVVVIRQFAPPPDLTTPAGIEATYKRQIDRMLELATDPEKLGWLPSDDAEDIRLFAAPEILEARFRLSSDRYVTMTDKHYTWLSRGGDDPWSRPAPGQAVVKHFWDQAADSTRKDVMEYHREVLDSTGKSIGVILVLDLGQLTASTGRPPWRGGN